eukprot:PRCOL_00006820-RA
MLAAVRWRRAARPQCVCVCVGALAPHVRARSPRAARARARAVRRSATRRGLARRRARARALSARRSRGVHDARDRARGAVQDGSGSCGRPLRSSVAGVFAQPRGCQRGRERGPRRRWRQRCATSRPNTPLPAALAPARRLDGRHLPRQNRQRRGLAHRVRAVRPQGARLPLPRRLRARSHGALRARHSGRDRRHGARARLQHQLRRVRPRHVPVRVPARGRSQRAHVCAPLRTRGRVPVLAFVCVLPVPASDAAAPRSPGMRS